MIAKLMKAIVIYDGTRITLMRQITTDFLTVYPQISLIFC